jgi:2-phosphoglycolate phosphatase
MSTTSPIPAARTTEIRTVLFDLDGTLADTAPDLAHALNALRTEHDLPALDYARIRPEASHGSLALIRLGFQVGPGDPGFDELRRRFLEIYAEHLCEHTRLFPGMAELLEGLGARGLTWGIVTNKPAFLTDPLIARLGLASRATCVVSGDTTTNRKPHPEPVLHACTLAGRQPAQCLYVGDAERDIQAGRHAGMPTAVALFGYIRAQEDPDSWGADTAIREPLELLAWLDAHG